MLYAADQSSLVVASVAHDGSRRLQGESTVARNVKVTRRDPGFTPDAADLPPTGCVWLSPGRVWCDLSRLPLLERYGDGCRSLGLTHISGRSWEILVLAISVCSRAFNDLASRDDDKRK